MISSVTRMSNISNADRNAGDRVLSFLINSLTNLIAELASMSSIFNVPHPNDLPRNHYNTGFKIEILASLSMSAASKKRADGGAVLFLRYARIELVATHASIVSDVRKTPSSKSQNVENLVKHFFCSLAKNCYKYNISPLGLNDRIRRVDPRISLDTRNQLNSYQTISVWLLEYEILMARAFCENMM